MANLDFFTAGSWVPNLSTGRIARWGDMLVHYRRSSSNFDTIIGDTGATPPGLGGSITLSGAGSVTNAMYARAAEGDDTYLYLCKENNTLVRVETDGTVTTVGNRPGTGGTWLAVTGRLPEIITTQTIGSGFLIAEFDKPTDASPSTIVSGGFTPELTGAIAVDEGSGDFFVSFFTSSARTVRRYTTAGTLVWTATIPNATADSVRPVNGLAMTSIGLIAYTTDNDAPGGTRINNNWWLIDPSTGDEELITVTVDGDPFASWADTVGVLDTIIGSICVVGTNLYAQADDGSVIGASFESTAAQVGWWVGVVGWGAGGPPEE